MRRPVIGRADRKRTVGGLRPRQPRARHHQRLEEHRAYLVHGEHHAQQLSETVKIYEQGKAYYDALKKVKNLLRDARKVQQTILMVGEITYIYVNNFQRMLSDPYFSPEELSAIAVGYTKLLEESASVLTDLKTVVNENGLSMGDKDRMDVIDKCYTRMHEYRGLVRYYTNKNIGVSYPRAKKKNDQDRVLSLYGTPGERYW